VPSDEPLPIPTDPASLLQANRARHRGVAVASACEQQFRLGPDGHRITGEIAQRIASPNTKAALGDLLSDGRYDTLAEAATGPTYARNHLR
jgi:hypothetical protein